jgi:hypothetical protein
MPINDLLKHNIEKINRIKIYIFSVEGSILLPTGIYYLIRDNSLIIPSLIIFIVAYTFVSIKTIIFKKVSQKELQEETKTFKKNIIILIIISLCSLILSALRKEIIGKYFIGQHIMILTFWFIIGIVLANVVVAIILLIKMKMPHTPDPAS